MIEVNHNEEVLCKVVDKEAVAEALAFGNHRSNFMQTVLERIDFFK